VFEGDLNPETGEISLNLDLNSKTGEKSPDRGVHAVVVAGAPCFASSELSRLAAEAGLLIRPPGGADACRLGRASAVLVAASWPAQRVTRARCGR
jgi:hypothetical protein